MDARRIAALAAVGCLVVWGVKAIVIGIAGDTGISPLEGPLFALGLVLFIAAWIALGIAVTAGRPVVLRVLGAIAGLAVAALLFLFIEDPVGGMVPDSAGWVREEAGLWVISILTAIVVLAVTRSRYEPGAT